jgi:hypothetical protein
LDQRIQWRFLADPGYQFLCLRVISGACQRQRSYDLDVTI